MGVGIMEQAHERIDALSRFKSVTEKIVKEPYSAVNYYTRALIYRELCYPDLAAGDAYKALLLVDEILDESGEYHEPAYSSFQSSGSDINDLKTSVYGALITSLMDCKCYKSCYTYAKQWERIAGKSIHALPTSSDVLESFKDAYGHSDSSVIDPMELPDSTLVRREIYPWNDQEPDRTSEAYVKSLNQQLEALDGKCVVQVTECPILSGGAGTIKQLGLFANEDIDPGEVVLNERSFLTANNNLYDSLCDACSAELPKLSNGRELFSCPECDDTIFCSQVCLDGAMELFHPAICSKDIDPIARDTNPKEASDALYFLLLGRTIAMAETQDVHPLQLKETSSLWGEFEMQPPDPSQAKLCLPFSFAYNVLYPLHLLTQMDIDIYATTPKYDFWIINTLYAKFRGVASGRPNRRTGKPEVCAVHPLWSLANHSCAPNVTWEPSGDIKLVVRQGKQIVRWGPDKGRQNAWDGGIKKGEEILNHYCDIELDVKERREWAQGPLGGDCMCERCIWEEETGLAADVARLEMKT